MLTGIFEDTELLQEVLDDPKKIEQIAERSYAHDNGFLKIVIDEYDGKKIRLHVFPENREIPPAENWHNHRWPFASKILVGSIIHDIATFNSSDLGSYVKWAYTKMPDGTFSLLPTKDRFKMATKFTRTYVAGDQYQLPTGDIHRIIPTGEFTATMVRTELADSDVCFQWAQDTHDVGQNGENQSKTPLTCSEVRGYIKSVLDKIGMEVI